MIAALTLLLSGLAVCKAARISVLENELNLDREDQGGVTSVGDTWTQSHCCAKPVSACCTTTPTTRNNGWNNNGNNGWHAPQPSHTCVAGSFIHCNSPHQWTGNQCCLQGHYTCMAGSFIHCNSPSVWTGQQCCMRGHVSNGRGWGLAEVANAEVSVEMQNEENEVTEAEVSKAIEMQDDEGTWSQSHCCAKPVSACCTTTPTTRNNGWNNNGNNGWRAPQPSQTCVAGSFVHCRSPHRWTGNQCCLQGHYTCMAGSFIHCNSPSVWTGQQCCMRGHVSNGRGWGLAEVANAEVSAEVANAEVSVEMQNEENEVAEAPSGDGF